MRYEIMLKFTCELIETNQNHDDYGKKIKIINN